MTASKMMKEAAKEATKVKLKETKMSNLFAGKPGFDGLSNERGLIAECPLEFREFMNWDSNPWCEYITKLFFGGAVTSNWKWKTKDEQIKTHQLNCFHALLSGWGLKHEHKTAVAGWMLSEMLEEIPVYIAPKKKNV